MKKFKKNRKKTVKFRLLVGLIYSRIVIGRWNIIRLRRLTGTFEINGRN
jgi:hypothetical protein